MLYPQSIQSELLRLYQSHFNKDELTPYDTKVLNKTLFTLLKSYYFKEQADDKVLFENNEVCVVKSINSIQKTHDKDFGSITYNCLQDFMGNQILPIEEEKYNICDYMSDEEFEEYESNLKNKTFYSESIYENMKAVLTEPVQKQIKNIIDTIKNSDDAEELVSNLKSTRQDKDLIVFMGFIEQNYDKKRVIEDILSGKDLRLLSNQLLQVGDEGYYNLLHPSWDSMLNNTHAINNLKRRYELDETYNAEKVLSCVFDNDEVAADIIEGRYDEQGSAQPIKNFDNKKALKDYCQKKLLACFNECAEKIESSVDFNQTIEQSFKKENDVEPFLSYLENFSHYKMLLEDDPLKQQIHLKKANEYVIDKITMEDFSYDTFNDYLVVNYDWQNQYFKNNGLGLIEPNFYESHSQKDDISFLLLAYNEHEIVGGATLKSGVIFNGYDKDDIVLSGIATNERFRNQKIAENLFREALDYCRENKKVLVRTSPTKDGDSKIKDKFNKIAQNDYNDVLVVNNEDRDKYLRIKEYAKEHHIDNKKAHEVFKQFKDEEEALPIKKMFENLSATPPSYKLR